jgi:hypothetical protein
LSSKFKNGRGVGGLKVKSERLKVERRETESC